jgi:hypothetical protein
MPCSASRLYSSGIASPVQQKPHHPSRRFHSYLHVNASCRQCAPGTQNCLSVAQHICKPFIPSHPVVFLGSPLQHRALSAIDGIGGRKSHALLLGLAARQPQWCVAPTHSSAGPTANHLHKPTPFSWPGLSVRAGNITPKFSDEMQRTPCLAAGGPKLTQTLASSETSATSTLTRNLYLCNKEFAR